MFIFESIDGFLALLTRRKTKSLKEFAKLVVEKRCPIVEVGAKLEYRGIVNILTAKIMFTAQPASGGRILSYEETLFNELGIGGQAEMARLFLRADLKLHEAKAILPDVPVEFTLLILPTGILIPLTAKVRAKMHRVAIENGIV